MADITIQPKFKGTIRIARSLIYLFFLIPFYIIMADIFDRDKYFMHIFYMRINIMSVALPIIIVSGMYWANKIYYKNTFFILKNDSLIEKAKLLTATRKEIPYKNIKEIEIIRGPMQDLFGLASIVIHTQATSSGGNDDSGLTLYDVENADDLYDMIKKKSPI